MYKVSKRMEIAGAHKLNLDYNSKCKNLHGHNWIITVYCEATELNHNGMVVDFKKVKELVHGKLDHAYVNEVLPDINPTAENIAKWACDEINNYLSTLNNLGDGNAVCFKVTVQESEGNVADYYTE